MHIDVDFTALTASVKSYGICDGLWHIVLCDLYKKGQISGSLSCYSLLMHIDRSIQDITGHKAQELLSIKAQKKNIVRLIIKI